MARRGRPPILDAVKQGQVLALLSVGCSKAVAARFVGCVPATITRTARRDPQFAAALKQALCSPEIGYLKSIQRASRKEQYWRAAAWALERIMPEKYARRDPEVITIDQVARLLAQMSEIVVSEVPARYRKAVVKRLDQLATLLRATKSPEGKRQSE